MKKVLVFFAVSMMMLWSATAFCQIKITRSEDKLVEVKNLHFGKTNKLMKKGDTYFYAITKTTNQFDHGMVMQLGTTKDEIVSSLKVLYENIDTIGDEEVINIDNGFGVEYRLQKWVLTEEEIKTYKRMGVKEKDLDPCYKVFSDDNAGYGTIWKSALKQAIDYFN